MIERGRHGAGKNEKRGNNKKKTKKGGGDLGWTGGKNSELRGLVTDWEGIK